MDLTLGKRTLLNATTVGLSLVFAACVPWPHYDQHTPPLYGVVTQNNQPIEGAVVSVTSAKHTCSRETEMKSAVTDAQGKFRIDPIREFDLFVFIAIGDCFYSTVVDVKNAGQTYPGFDIPGSISQDPVEIRCELAAPMRQDQLCRPVFKK